MTDTAPGEYIAPAADTPAAPAPAAASVTLTADELDSLLERHGAQVQAAIASGQQAPTAAPADPEPKPLPAVGDVVVHTVTAPWGEVRTVGRVLQADAETHRVWLEVLETRGPLSADDVDPAPDL